MPPAISVLGGNTSHLDGTHVVVTATNIPDDVWIDIFESIDLPATLAVLMRTCKRFNGLALKPLLRELRWGKVESTRKNLEAWDPLGGIYKNVVSMPKKITIAVGFEFPSNVRNMATDLTVEYELHDWMYLQLPRFASLNELAFEGTVISPYVYTVLAQIPTLRTLSISNCTVFPLYTAFADRRVQRTPTLPDLLQLQHGHTHLFPAAAQSHIPALHIQAQHAGLQPPSTAAQERFPFEDLPITHLSLHRGANLADHDSGPYHPLYLVTARNLTSLAITWTPNVAAVYARRKWLLPKLETLDVVMPLLSRDLIDSLVIFVANCPLAPRIQLTIERHNLSDQQMGTVAMPLRGVWSYKGPLGLAAFSMVREESGTLTHMVMNEPMDLPGLLDGIEKLPRCVQDLEIQVRKWDVEVLFAIRSLFPEIRRLVVKYGSGTFPGDFFVTLGSNILFDLKSLHTIKLLQDRACNVTSRQLASAGGGGGFFNSNMNPPHPTLMHTSTSPDLDDAYFPSSPSLGGWVISRSREQRDEILEHADLKDYLIGWNRYCKALRVVQLERASWWERRFEGDRWNELEVRKPQQETVGDVDGLGFFV
ncbi:hypothetical protein NLJ89_g7534 [Agrocybe chaxingu]|uniref:F-box domain-containing protein n=1 Tax=Agrocybe chaxingu TaxID=84603 RepID=A0A9W8MVC6_9AGAR|nr:hypothetical protein NLJ89_g7534 [Agrocybe chaxingu]